VLKADRIVESINPNMYILL